MNRFIQNALAAVAAVMIFAVSFSAVVTVPANPALAVSGAPILA